MENCDNVKIVLVDDEEQIRSLYLTVLEEFLPEAEIHEAEDGLEALNLIMAVEPDLVISDIKMPNMDGRRLLKVSREFKKSCQFIFISGYGKDYLYEFLRYGAFDVLEKPLNLDRFEDSLSRALYFIANKNQAIDKMIATLAREGVREEVIAKVINAQEGLLRERYTNYLKEDLQVNPREDRYHSQGPRSI